MRYHNSLLFVYGTVVAILSQHMLHFDGVISIGNEFLPRLWELLFICFFMIRLKYISIRRVSKLLHFVFVEPKHYNKKYICQINLSDYTLFPRLCAKWNENFIIIANVSVL